MVLELGAGRGVFVVRSCIKGKVVSKIECIKKVKKKQNSFSTGFFFMNCFHVRLLPKAPFFIVFC